MRRDLIIGIVGSLVIHFGAYELSQLTKKGPPPPPKRDEERVIDITMPKIEPEEQQAEDDSVKPVPIEFAPPMQADVPQPMLDAFVQPLQPPPPPNVQIARMQVVVPQGGTGWRAGIKIFDESQLDQKPVPTFRPQPTYPYEMRRNGISGEVVVEFIVNTSGEVSNAFAANSTNRAFEEDAVRGVMRWKFRPGRKDGHVVNTRMEVPIEFKLDSDE